jgi:hypothetical protein
VSLDIAAFDAQVNPQPTSEEPAFQSIQAQPENNPAQHDPSPTPQLASSKSYIGQSSQNQQTILTMPTTAFTFSFAVPSSQPAKPEKADTRCAPCTKALCVKRLTCEGRIRRDNCVCGHPQLKKGERVRISEQEVLKRLALRDNQVRL